MPTDRQKLIRELDTQVYADGMQFELSTGYHQVNIRNYLLAWHTMAAYDVPVPDAFRDVLEKMHSANIRLMMPDGRLPDLNDGGWHPVAGLLDDAVKHYPERADFKWVHSGGAEGQPPAETSLAFENCGYYVMRTGWQLSLIGRTRSRPGHQQKPVSSSHSPAQWLPCHSPSVLPPLQRRRLSDSQALPL